MVIKVNGQIEILFRAEDFIFAKLKPGFFKHRLIIKTKFKRFVLKYDRHGEAYNALIDLMHDMRKVL